MSSSLLNNTYLSSINIHLISNQANISISDTHKIFYLNKPIQYPPHTHALISLSSFNMPYTFYQFRPGVNNTFDIQTTDLSGNVNTETITIDEGNYSISELASHINSSLTAVRLSLGLTTLSMTVNYTNNKIFFTALPLMASVEFQNILCWEQLGFANANTVAYTLQTNLQVPYIFNLAGDASLFLRVHNLGINNLNSNNLDGILCNIPNEYTYLNYIYYKPSEIQFFKTTSLLNVIEISVLDQNMIDIGSLNLNSGFRLTLTVHFSYNKEITLKDEDMTTPLYKYSIDSDKNNDEK